MAKRPSEVICDHHTGENLQVKGKGNKNVSSMDVKKLLFDLGPQRIQKT